MLLPLIRFRTASSTTLEKLAMESEITALCRSITCLHPYDESRRLFPKKKRHESLLNCEVNRTISRTLRPAILETQLTRLDLKVQRDKREDEALFFWFSSITQAHASNNNPPSNPVRDNRIPSNPPRRRSHSRPPVIRFSPSEITLCQRRPFAISGRLAHLEGDMLLVYPHLQLLSPNDVFLRPRDVIFSIRRARSAPGRCERRMWDIKTTDFVISDSRMIRLISSTTVVDTNTRIHILYEHTCSC